MKIQEKYLSRCIQLAGHGLGKTAPNPMVGAVVTHGDQIIGEGYTSPFGGAHAEVNAIRSVRQPERLREATLYVTLEPCCHHGKTPPCTDLILESGIPRVVIGLQDPHEKVAGKGIAQLRAGGCQVTVGVLEAACRHHHRRFLTFHEKKRPFIILKWAQSPDGFLAPEPALRKPERPFWISGNRSRQLVHKWRTEEAAILVGTETALADNPRLTPRDWYGPDPLRILIDRTLRVPGGTHLLDGKAPTLVVCSEPGNRPVGPHTEYLPLDFGPGFEGRLCAALHQRQILSLLVEGGARTLEAFLQHGLWDEARVFTGPRALQGGLRAPHLSGRLLEQRQSGEDLLQIWKHD
ncbi:MAG TPA: bifunctional diaminohydroxyphosphoribosylaminopyrimidine deaminase/5-amino-6-(5-phosphoribosylamino)uracil reductase RibD [Robiginitalea sp.]|nr:bifunctional diaminohydroxyphosphoribosylaminopyrimidine deaminase/5-amino-6-(5-phosphoribosylamino)uracil reductase RibD [Robiginitalea sp.]